MKSRHFKALIVVMLFAGFYAPVIGQSPHEQVFKDDLLDNLVGEWKLVRKMQGRISEHVVKADWVLNHQFIRIQMRHVENPPAYEATVFIGWDHARERYIVHWLDVFGGKSSETLGHGTSNGNTIKFTFAYPEHPFVNTFTWNPEAKTWNFLMQQKNPNKSWSVFAEDNLSRIAPAK
ncbi:MAG TPA: hypothetical protein VJV03_15630 [Pyrinomonadaceae bacterium]|nr:hypothetical protein [Pyrinomonadaceae bacterium]